MDACCVAVARCCLPVLQAWRAWRSTRLRLTRTSRTGDGPGGSGDKTPDWDALWKAFVQARGRQHLFCAAHLRGCALTPSSLLAFLLSQRTAGTAERYVDRPSPPPGWGRAARDDIKNAERGVLDAWTSPTFTKAWLVVVLMTALVFVVFIGPPPPDGRCTLPWC